MLEAFGVEASAEAVYMAMLEKPKAGPDELAASLGMTSEQIRAALDQLAQLALLRPSWEDPLTLRPVTPEIGLESLLARQQAELLNRQHQIEQGRAALAVILADQAGRRIGSRTDIEECIGIDAIRERLEQLTTQVRFEVLAFTPDGPAPQPSTYDAARPLDEQLLSRGVTMRTLYLDSVRNHPETAAYANWLAKLGGEVRTTGTLPLRMIVVDRETAVVPLDPESGQGAAILHGTGAVAALCALFEQTWAAATPFGSVKERDHRGLTQQEKALLRLLAQGHTDEVAARKLGVSDRTVRRLIADMMGQMGARSRFQAGARATEFGWLAHEGAPTGGGTALSDTADSDA